MKVTNILLTGSAGQLARCFKLLESQFPLFNLLASDKNSFDITDPNHAARNDWPPLGAVINCAAYTAVDLAETNRESAWEINVKGPQNLARMCKTLGIPLVHFSSDYVYDNGLTRPLKESDPCNPKSVYAITKYAGEQEAFYYNPNTLIIRTSWVYSEQGQNFVKTIRRLAKEKQELKVVNDQIGAPTYAPDLAYFTLQVLEQILSQVANWPHYGIYNYSNLGLISWYDFAEEIVSLNNSACKVYPVSTHFSPRPAPRPMYSGLDLFKAESTFGLKPIPWKESLQKCVENLIKTDS